MAGCKKDEVAEHDVIISNLNFSPASLTVNSGTTVTWLNNEDITHTVTSNTAVFDSGDMGKGKTYSYTFLVAGTYLYYCAYHPGMTGIIIVK